MKSWIRAGIGGLLIAVTTPASAAVVFRTFSFTASNFGYAVPGTTPPYATVSGKFTITYDTAQTYVNASQGIILRSVNLPLTPPSLVFGYSSVGPPFLRVGGAQNGEGFVLSTTDFSLNIFDAGGPNPFYGPFAYTAPGFNISAFVSNNVTGSFVEGAGAIPEPSTWALLILGFGMIGWSLRRSAGQRPAKLAIAVR